MKELKSPTDLFFLSVPSGFALCILRLCFLGHTLSGLQHPFPPPSLATPLPHLLFAVARDLDAQQPHSASLANSHRLQLCSPGHSTRSPGLELLQASHIVPASAQSGGANCVSSLGTARAKVWSWQTGFRRLQKAPWSRGRRREPAPEQGRWGLAVAARRVKAVWGCVVGAGLRGPRRPRIGRGLGCRPRPTSVRRRRQGSAAAGCQGNWLQQFQPSGHPVSPRPSCQHVRGGGGRSCSPAIPAQAAAREGGEPREAPGRPRDQTPHRVWAERVGVVPFDPTGTPGLVSCLS